MICRNCGKEIDNNAKFCNNCGVSLEENQEIDKENDLNDENKNKANCFKKNIFIGIIMAIFIILVLFFLIKLNNALKPMELDGEGYSHTVKIKYEPKYQTIELNFILKESIIEQWQIDLYNKYKLRDEFVFQYFFANENKEPIEPHMQFSFVELELGKPLSTHFIIYNQTLKDFVNFKATFLQKSNSLAWGVPDIFSRNKKIKTTARKQFTELEKVEKENSETMKRVEKYAFNFDENRNEIPVDYNPRECTFKIKDTCFGYPFYAKGMSYTDCKKNKNELGIKYCQESDDLFASTAYICGGVKNMPTPDELVMLAQDMYNDNTINNLTNLDCSYNCNEQRAQRDNNKKYLEYFRHIKYANPEVISEYHEKNIQNIKFEIISNRELEPKTPPYNKNFSIFTRIYEHDKTKLYIDSKTSIRIGEYPISICIKRDRGYNLPKKEKFPIKIQDFKQEAENVLF